MKWKTFFMVLFWQLTVYVLVAIIMHFSTDDEFTRGYASGAASVFAAWCASDYYKSKKKTITIS